jgi:DNA-binding IclR family transcriptional regulator
LQLRRRRIDARATQTAAGWLLLSRKTDEQVDRLARRANIAAKTDRERVNVSNFLNYMRKLRRKDWTYVEDVPMKGAATVFVLLETKLQGQATVLGVGGHIERIREVQPEALRMLHDGARSLSATAMRSAPSVPMTLS